MAESYADRQLIMRNFGDISLTLRVIEIVEIVEEENK